MSHDGRFPLVASAPVNAAEHVAILEEDHLGGPPGGENPVAGIRSIGHRLEPGIIAGA